MCASANACVHVCIHVCVRACVYVYVHMQVHVCVSRSPVEERGGWSHSASRSLFQSPGKGGRFLNPQVQLTEYSVTFLALLVPARRRGCCGCCVSCVSCVSCVLCKRAYLSAIVCINTMLCGVDTLTHTHARACTHTHTHTHTHTRVHTRGGALPSSR